MEAIMDNMDNSSIRVDTATKKGSIIDVIRMMLGCTSGNAHTSLRRLQEDFPELGAELGASGTSLSKIRINGKGLLTPVADAKTLIEIAMLLPGKGSTRFRWDSARTVCRVLGGDAKLLGEIQHNDRKWKLIKGGSLIQQALLKETEYVEPVQKAPRVSECLVRNNLASEVGGQVEIETPAGFIDVLSDKEVIEVKYYRQWKHGLGQVLAYQTYYPLLTKRLHLFAHTGDLATEEVFALALSVCDVHAVEVTFEEVQDVPTLGKKRAREEDSDASLEVCKRRKAREEDPDALFELQVRKRRAVLEAEVEWAVVEKKKAVLEGARLDMMIEHLS